MGGRWFCQVGGFGGAVAPGHPTIDRSSTDLEALVNPQPYRCAHGWGISRSSCSPQQSIKLAASPFQFLAVDDDANQLAAVRRVLRRSRFEVTTCTNPRRALHLVATEQPDLILLDVSMPTMSGHEFLHRLRRIESARRSAASDTSVVDIPYVTPVIFLSGLSESHQRVSALDAGAEDYITKPFDPDELRARIRNQLRRVRQQRERAAPEHAERWQLEAALNQVQETARACGAPLLDLDANLELTGRVRRSELQKELLSRAKRDVGQITRSLMRITDGFATKGNH